ncbi:unnamed protein product [Auanema sp. JU1783]|nr:unnamed protein product [Auanema sp. JU1783]
MTSSCDFIELTRWMTLLPPNLTSRPICELKIPGSHDSGADRGLNCKLPVANDEKGIVALAGKIPRIRKGIRRWAITQRLGIEDQLTCGVRYFDFRVSHPPENLRRKLDDFILVHALYGHTLVEALKKIRSFLDVNPLEIIIIDINHAYGLDETAELSMRSKICEILGKESMCPQMLPSLCTLDYMHTKKYQIITLMPQSDNTNCSFWSQNFIRSPWINTNNRFSLFTNLQKNLEYDRPQHPRILYVTQCVLTAHLSDVILNWKSSLERELSEETTVHAIKWMNSLSDCLKTNLNIVMSDVVCEAFVKSVIQLNYV